MQKNKENPTASKFQALLKHKCYHNLMNRQPVKHFSVFTFCSSELQDFSFVASAELSELTAPVDRQKRLLLLVILTSKHIVPIHTLVSPALFEQLTVHYKRFRCYGVPGTKYNKGCTSSATGSREQNTTKDAPVAIRDPGNKIQQRMHQ